MGRGRVGGGTVPCDKWIVGQTCGFVGLGGGMYGFRGFTGWMLWRC